MGDVLVDVSQSEDAFLLNFWVPVTAKAQLYGGALAPVNGQISDPTRTPGIGPLLVSLRFARSAPNSSFSWPFRTEFSLLSS
jgi:hypothetical protein